MKIVIVAAMFPPAGRGGAEDCAHSFAQWASFNGHDVVVIMAATDDEAVPSFTDGPVNVHQVQTDHIYPIAMARNNASWKKPIWYLQDHIGGRTPAKVAQLVADEQPDIIMIHYLQGFGYRTISTLAGLGIPIVMVLHDLGLVCCRMGMFRDDAECHTPCVECRLSTAFKSQLFSSALEDTPIGFISPSKANLDKIGQYFPIDRFPRRRVLNTKNYPVASRDGDARPGLRLLYAGKLEVAKGIDRLAAAVEMLRSDFDVSLSVAGTGSLFDSLTQRYASNSRFSFAGFVSQQRLSQMMAESSLLCVPSIWPENSPGVVAQAILNGLPVVATDHGGLPELVRDGIDGRILVDDSITGWVESLNWIMANLGVIEDWRGRLIDVQPHFNIDTIGHETLAFMQQLRTNLSDS